MFEIGNDVVDMFGTHRNADSIFSDTRIQTLLLRELFVGGRPGVDGQSLRIANAVAKGLASNNELAKFRVADTYFARLEISLKLSTT